jgi:dienelactone hydrolase
MRIPVRTLIALALVVPIAGLSSAAPPIPPDPYPVESFTYPLGNVVESLENRDLGNYNFEAGMWGTVRRIIQRYPEIYLDPNMNLPHELQVAIDSLTHNRPRAPYSHFGDAGHPMFMPDWDHDGTFGDGGGVNVDGIGDFDAETDEQLDTAYFRVLCYDAGYRPHHLFASSGCDAQDSGKEPYQMGVAHELKVINARGLVLDATLFFPSEAFAGTGCPAIGSREYSRRASWTSCVSPENLAAASLPGVVFSNGFASRQEHYYWFAMRMAAAGYVVLTYDPAGQGESEGTFFDTIGLTDTPRVAGCQFGGACRDQQDMVRWFVGQAITRVRDDGLRVEPRKNPATNPANPAAPVLDESRVALAGNSMGALATISYVDHLGRGKGTDGRLLPMLRAAIPMSGGGNMSAVVPVQLQTFDYDGSPTLVGPGVFSIFLGQGTQGIGYPPMKETYDRMRASRKGGGPLSLIVIEGGVHTDHVNVPFVPRTLWGIAIAGHYAEAWLGCHVLSDATACATASAPAPHLSRGWASEYDADGPAGPAKSRCIQVPDKAMLNQSPADFVSALLGEPVYDCVP